MMQNTNNVENEKLVILRDKQEKIPWNFEFYGVDVIRTHLDTGDYTLPGFEKQFCIERKRTTGELAINIGSKGKQFEAELARMASYRFCYVICEFPFSDLDKFPHNSTIPESRWKYLKISSKFLKSRIFTWSEKYNIEFIFCDGPSAAEHEAYTIIQSCWKRLNEK